MTRTTFVTRLESCKSNRLIGAAGGLEWLINVWKDGAQYILTWEECPAGKQYDESLYTWDEVHRFDTADQVIVFLQNHGLRVGEFKP